MKYDSTFHPMRCYHIELQWVICTGSAVQEMISHLQRQARSCGVTMIQTPVEYDITAHPFRAPVRIPLSPGFDAHTLLKRFNFILDPNTKKCEWYQYMHNTGVAFIRVEDDFLVWTYNYTPTLQALMPKAFSILQELKDVCADLSSQFDNE